MYAILNNYIKQEQYDEYVYALEIILNILITDITMIIIGLAMGMIWECILFWLVYKILRRVSFLNIAEMLFIILHYVSGCIGSCKVCSVQYDRMGLAYLNSADNTFYSFTC